MSLTVDNYIINKPVIDIIRQLKLVLRNGKLKEIQDKSSDIVVSCPFHDGGQEHSASCFIRKDDGVFHCFGCGEKGSFLKFVAGCFDSSYDYAKKWLVDNFNGELVEQKIFIGEDIKINRKPTKRYLDESVLNQYQSWTPYLAQRKLSRETCERFKVKYDPKYRQVIFPAYDIHGRLVMLPKRSIDTKTFYLDKDQEKPVYCLDYIMKNNIKTVAITEGPFDCLTGWEYGFPTIATLGRISDYQIDQINKSCINIIYAMFDNDAAGKSFLVVLKKRLSKRIIVVETQFPANKKDVNDLSREEFEKIIKNARV